MRTVETKLSEKKFLERLTTLCVQHRKFDRGYEDQDCYVLKASGNKFRIGKHFKQIGRGDGYYIESLYGRYRVREDGTVVVRYCFAKPPVFLIPMLLICLLTVPAFSSFLFDAIVHSDVSPDGLLVTGCFAVIGLSGIFAYSSKGRTALSAHLNRICKTE